MILLAFFLFICSFTVILLDFVYATVFIIHFSIKNLLLSLWNLIWKLSNFLLIWFWYRIVFFLSNENLILKISLMFIIIIAFHILLGFNWRIWILCLILTFILELIICFWIILLIISISCVWTCFRFEVLFDAGLVKNYLFTPGFRVLVIQALIGEGFVDLKLFFIVFLSELKIWRGVFHRMVTLYFGLAIIAKMPHFIELLLVMVLFFEAWGLTLAVKI